MKKYSLIASLICLAIISSSCGKKSTTQITPEASAEGQSQAAPIVAEKPVVNVNAPFVGVWGGYLDNSFTTITINSDGSASIKELGASAMSRSIYMQDNRYYLVNNVAKTGVPIKVNGNVLTLTVSKSEISFIKEE
jgi:hypothetical protein